MSRVPLVLAALILLLGGVGQVKAGPVTVGNPKWYEFGWLGGDGTFAFAGTLTPPSSGGNSQPLDSPPWTFTAATATAVTLTDAFSTGDTFTLFDNNVAIGTTPAVPTNINLTSNPAVTATSLSPVWSHGIFILPAGSHSLTIKVANSNFGFGAAYFRLASVKHLPEPSTLTMLAMSAVGLAGYGWRRRKLVAA